MPGVWVMLSCASVCSMHASLLDQLEIRGLVTMGIDGCAGSGRKKVLGIDPEMLGERGLCVCVCVLTPLASLLTVL